MHTHANSAALVLVVNVLSDCTKCRLRPCYVIEGSATHLEHGWTIAGKDVAYTSSRLLGITSYKNTTIVLLYSDGSALSLVHVGFWHGVI